MMLSLDPAYRSFGGEVEASSTPTICRPSDSRRHQLSAIALGRAQAQSGAPSDREATEREIEQTRLKHLATAPATGRMPWCDYWPAWSASVLILPTCWQEGCRGTCGIGAPWRVMPVSPVRPTKARRNGGRRDWPARAMRASGESN